MASCISATDWNGSIAQVVVTSFIAQANWNIIAMPCVKSSRVWATHHHQSSNIVTRIASNTPISRHRVVHECSGFEKCSRLIPAVFKRVIISRTMLQLFKSHCNIMFSRDFSRDSIVAYASEKQIQLKSVQLDSIENVLAKRDTIVVAKTGEGKSLIFQIATSMLNKTTVTTTITSRA